MNGWTLWLTRKLWPITELTSEHLFHWLKDDLMSKPWYQGVSVIWGDGIAESTCPSTVWLLWVWVVQILNIQVFGPLPGAVAVPLPLVSGPGHTMHWELRKCYSWWGLLPHCSCFGLCVLWPRLGFGLLWYQKMSLDLASPCLLSVDFCPAVLVLLRLCVHGFWVSLEHRDTSVSTLTNKALVDRLLHWPRTCHTSTVWGLGQWGQYETKSERLQSGRRRVEIKRRVGG